MKKLSKNTVAGTAIALSGFVTSIQAAQAQGVPTMGQTAQIIELIQMIEQLEPVELLQILEDAQLQNDPVVQKQIDLLREELAENTLTNAEADALFSEIINSKGMTDDD